jgi:hypothetical protein
MFKAVWGFDPEEALRAQNAFRQTSVRGVNASLDELERESDDELRIPQAEDLQVCELHRMFGL